MTDFRLLQEVRQAQSAAALYDAAETVRQQHGEMDIDELAHLIQQARRVNAAIESGQMGTIGHDDLKQLLLEKQPNPYPLRGVGSVGIAPSVPALAADEWDAVRGVLLNDCA